MYEEINTTYCSDDWSYFWYNLSLSNILHILETEIDYKILMYQTYTAE